MRLSCKTIEEAIHKLEDSGKFLSWDIKIAADLLSKVEIGSVLDKRFGAPVNETNDAWEMLKGRQLFLIIRQQFEVDENGEAQANVEHNLAVKCNQDGIVMFKYHWNDVFSTLQP